MNADKPSGLELDDFLPKKMQGLGIASNFSTPPSSASRYVPNTERHRIISLVRVVGLLRCLRTIE